MNSKFKFNRGVVEDFTTMKSKRNECFELSYITNESALRFAWSFSIIGLVVEFVVAIDEARVRFTDDAHPFFWFLWNPQTR
ncbi:hypothetical protein ACN38_g3334 [Penicillium nordicum]|uniref:Uncharacterized protein n=1 Tax=Penicillium nordicum TaxID=229535 RepID=A0A0M8P5S2_9EURO|nr:hypothetical protein ACN38_g3334 [Penicillium nordicum]